MKKKLQFFKKLLMLTLAFSTVVTTFRFTNVSYSVEAFSEKIGYVTGEEVNVRTNAGTGNSIICTLKMGSEVKVVGEATAPNNAVWYKIEFILNGENKTGYIHSNYVRTILADEDLEYEEYLSIQQFPESYRVYLRALHKAHPTWTFVALPTNLTWNEVVSKESELGANLIPLSSATSWKSLEEGAYDWSSGNWIGKDTASWVCASESIIKYYLDPRNFLRENSQILQFESLRYIEGEQTKEGIANILKGTFMDTEEYYNIFMEAGKETGVNPYHLASRCRQEVGVNGSNSTYDVKDSQYSEFNGYYNFFNIGASPSAEHNSMYNGLAKAKEEGWNTPEKSIKGGAAFLAAKYVLVEQDTLYLQKFDVVDGGNGLYWHQYMTNLEAASSEAELMKKAYSDLDEAFVTYYIPVYLEMPEYSFDKPSYNGSVKCVLSELQIEGMEFTREFDPYITEYTVKGNIDANILNITAKAYAPDAVITGAGQVTYDTNKQEIKVVCTGSDNSTLTYTIKFEKEGGNSGSSGNEDGNSGNSGENSGSTGGNSSSEDGSYGSTGNSDGYGAISGDVNNDGSVNISDAKLVLESVVGLTNLNESQIKLADVNKDDLVDINDVLAILKYISAESESV